MPNVPPLEPRTRQNTRAIVLTWPDNTLTVELATWLLKHPRPADDIIFAHGTGYASRQDVVATRNHIVRTHILGAPARFRWFLWSRVRELYSKKH